MKTPAYILAMVTMMLFLACGGGGGGNGSSVPAPMVGITPAGPININTSGSIAFLPSVTGTSDTAVTWTVDGIVNGNADVGAITPNGMVVMYTAPTKLGAHTITAISSANAQSTASVTLTVADTCAPAPTPNLIVNVKDAPYYAKGNGSTDDTAAIQAAVNVVAGTGGTVIVPAGTYLINPTLNSHAGIRLGNQMTLNLAAGAILQALPTSTSDYVVLLASNVQNVNICGGTLIGNLHNNSIPSTDTDEYGFGIMVMNSQHVVVDGVITKEFWCDGCYVGNNSQDVTLNNVVADNNRRNGMSITSVNGMVVRGSTFENSTGLTENRIFVCGNGVDIEPNLGETVSSVQFLGCTFATNPSYGISFGPAVANQGKAFVNNILVDGSTSTGNGFQRSASGIEASGTCGSQVSNNTVTGTTGIGIYLQYGANHNFVIGNTVSGTLSAAAPTHGWNGYGIELYKTGYNTVTGNTITNNAANGIIEFDSITKDLKSTNITSPNTLSGNGVAP